MTIWLDGNFWSQHFENSFVKQVTYYCDAIAKRVMPTFDNIEMEANDLTNSEYERLGELPYDENQDMSFYAEQAQETGFEYFDALNSVRQTILNLSIAALFHMFEQQMLVFHRHQVLHKSEENDINKIRIAEFKRRLLSGGIDIESIPSWKDIQELELIANSVKHAEGRSSTALQGLRPDLFEDPILRNTQSTSWLLFSPRVYLPLAGKDIYLTLSDLERFRLSLILFWREFGIIIKQHSDTRRP